MGGSLTGTLILILSLFYVLALFAVEWRADDAVEEVRFNRELLRTTIDNLSQGVSVVDDDLRLLAWNAKFIELFRLPHELVGIGKPMEDIIRYSAALYGPSHALDTYVSDRLAPMRNREPFLHERRREDGTFLEILGAPMPGGRYVTSYSDVTELRTAAVALRQANELLEQRVAERTRDLTQANAALTQATAVAQRTAKSQARFLAAASHDVLQPLQAARLFLGMLPSGQSGASEHLANADVSIDSAHRLLRSLLNLSQAEFASEKIDRRPVEVSDLLQELRKEFDFMAKEKGLILHFAPTRRWVLSNPELLRSVLQNLIINALRYTRQGAVLVGCRADRSGVRLEVRDSGPGIAPEFLKVIFDEFSRLAHEHDEPGAGLGLSIAERVCKLLGHDIAVKSQIGKGTVFSVTLPASTVLSHVQPRRITGRFPKNLKVLCVENDQDVLQGLKVLLTEWGAKVSTAGSMSEALQLNGDWDVVIADYLLERDGNGLDLIEALHGRAESSALLTATRSPEVVERAALLNVEIIPKPVSPLFLRSFLIRSRSSALVTGAS